MYAFAYMTDDYVVPIFSRHAAEQFAELAHPRDTIGFGEQLEIADPSPFRGNASTLLRP